MANIFVTGATGLIGTRLTERLVQEGHHVAGFTTSERGRQKLEHLGAEGFIGNILDKSTIEAAISRFQPDVIMHQITDLKNVDMVANTKVRIEGTRHLVDVAEKYGVTHIIS